MGDADDALRRLVEAALEDDRRCAGGDWQPHWDGTLGKSSVFAKTPEGGPCLVQVIVMRRGYGGIAPEGQWIAAARDREPELARAVLRLMEERDEARRSLKLSRYGHISDQALDAARGRYERIQEEVEAYDKRWGAVLDDAISDIDQLRKQRDEARRQASALRDQIEHEGCAVSREGETTYECSATKRCGLCRLRGERDALASWKAAWSAVLDDMRLSPPARRTIERNIAERFAAPDSAAAGDAKGGVGSEP